MASEVILPRVDMDMSTGKISKWLVEPGTKVAKGQPLFEIETDKAAMEIEAPAAGTVRPLVEASGEDIPVGSTVGWIYADGEREVPAGPAAPTSASQVEPDGARVAEEDRSFDSALPEATTDRSAASAATETADLTVDRPRATPLARRLARVQGTALGTLAGSGPRGRIQAVDVERARGAAAPRPVEAAPQPAPPQAAPPQPAAPPPRPTAVAAAGPLNIVQLRAGSGTPLVLVHGWGGDANGWRPFLAGQRSGRPVFALDLPGHGGSPLGRAASFVDLVDAVEAALLGAAFGPAHLVAHSLGAAVTAAAAARHGLDIRSLLLLSPAGLGPAINGAFLRGFLAATSEASLTPWMQELVSDPSAITAAFVRATLKAREGSDLVATQRQVAAAVFPDDTQAFSIRGDLATLAVPTRIVLGGADRIVPSGQAAGLPALIATHRFANVGHMPQFEAREAISAIVEQMTRE